jgi:hypothetical protein
MKAANDATIAKDDDDEVEQVIDDNPNNDDGALSSSDDGDDGYELDAAQAKLKLRHDDANEYDGEEEEAMMDQTNFEVIIFV